MTNSKKDFLVTKTDILIYKSLLENNKLCQKEISQETGLKEPAISRRLKVIDTFKFLDKEEVKGKNQNDYSIKKGFKTKLKNLVDLFFNIKN